MWDVLAAAAGQALAGRSRNKAAKQMRRDAITAADDTVKAAVIDQQSLINYRNDDERRLREATGVNFQKLRDDAVAAGFNPLTALAATGGAGYDGRGAVLTTPFVSMADQFARRADIFAGTGQAVVDTAGYFGDALAGAGNAMIDRSNLLSQQRHEKALQDASLRGATSSPGAIYGSRVSGGKSGGATPFVGAQTFKGFGPPSPFQTMSVYTPEGDPFEVPYQWAANQNWEPGYWMAPGDWEAYMGEAGQAASVVSSVPVYGDIGGAHTGVTLGWGSTGPSNQPLGGGGRSGGFGTRQPTPPPVQFPVGKPAGSSPFRHTRPGA